MDEHTFKLVMQRFDNTEALLKTYHAEVKAHVEDDRSIHKVVDRHATYFKILLLGLPVIGSALVKKFGWI